MAAALCAGTVLAPSATADIPRDDIKKLMRELVEAGAAGVQVKVHNDGNGYTAGAGVQQLGKKEPTPTNGRFRAGSITKPLVALTVLYLVEEGRLRLDDPVTKHLPAFGLDPDITVRMLLNHTSGLFNHTGDLNGDGTFEPGIPVSGPEYVKNINKYYHPEDLVRFALAKPPRFMPGAKWQYSNTNYVLAGLLIESVVKRRDYDEVVTAEVLRPLRMDQSSLPGGTRELPRPYAHGYLAYDVAGGDSVKHVVADVSTADMSWATSAGELVSTTRDLDRFITGLVDGTNLKPSSWAEMTTFVPAGNGVDYGLGLMRVDLPESCGGPVLGHTGGVPGYHSMMFSNADRTKRFQLSVTLGDVDLTNAEAAIRYTEAQQRLTQTLLCGRTDPGRAAVTVPLL